MSARRKSGPPRGAGDPGNDETLSLEAFKRLAEEARERGEPIDPLVERLVISTIKTVSDRLDEEEDADPSKGS